MSPRRTNSRDGLDRSSSGNRLSLKPLQPHHDDHPLEDRHLHVSTGNGEHVSLAESESEGLPLVTGARTSRARQNQHAVIDRHRRHRQEKTAPLTDDAAALISENQELRQQTMDLKLQLADAIAKIDELVQQNQQLMHMQNVRNRNGNVAQEEPVQDQTYREYNQDMKSAADANPTQKQKGTTPHSFDRSLGYGQGNSRPSSYLSKSGGPLQALGGAASVRNMFSSLRGEAEVTNASSVVASTAANKRSSLVSTRSSFYSARSMSSVSTSVRNDDSSQSISLHPDDLLRYGDHSNSNSIASIGHHQHQNHNT